jgi:hypothetical protein
MDDQEPILNEENRRFTLYPIKYTDIWNLYQQKESLQLMSIQGRKRVQSLFSIERFENEILQTLENINAS